MVHAGVYSAVTHYLQGREGAGSDADGKAVVAEDEGAADRRPAVRQGTIRADGRKMHDVYLFEVKKPAESKGPYDYYKLRATIPAEEAFRPLAEGKCPLVKS
jgi:branched-chain amino acid transport system substrate-binding protein